MQVENGGKRLIQKPNKAGKNGWNSWTVTISFGTTDLTQDKLSLLLAHWNRHYHQNR